MTKLVKNRILNYLYYLKSIGYEFHKNLDLYTSEIKNFKLPDNIDELKNVCKNCHLCELSKSRKNVLFGYGNRYSNIMFISYEPSDSEDEIGEYYVGKTGELLKNMIENVLKVKKEDVYFTSLLKCKSKDNLNQSNLDSCDDYFQKQIDIIKPRVIVTLGEKVYFHLTKNNDFLQMRGKELFYNDIILIPTYDPSFLLRNPSSKKDAYYDMIKIKNIMEKLN